ncbi:hypothetical protein HDE_07637 [Halotydeus destructor]|nr:hypothetical protein HDE_07637 [Halotydeus destructor]
MVSFRVGFALSAFLVVVSGRSVAEEEKILTKYARDFFTTCDPAIVTKLFSDNFIYNLFIPFKSNGADAQFRVGNIEVVPTEELQPSKVTIYDVKNAGQSYHFNVTYSLTNTALSAKESELVASDKWARVRTTINAPFGIATLTFKKDLIDGKVQVTSVSSSLDRISFDVAISNIDRLVAKKLEQATAAELLARIKISGDYSWHYVANRNLAKGFQSILF